MDIRGVKVLVTGGAGFIGSHLADRMISQGAQVTVLDNLSFGRLENVPLGATFLQMDLLDYPALHPVVRDQDVIFHLAACATTKESAMGWADPVFDYQVNAIGTLNMLRAVAEAGNTVRVIYASSAAVYGHTGPIPTNENHPTDPVSPYGISKLAGEKYCLAYYREYGIPVAILRIFNCYGPRQPRYVMHDLIMKLRHDSSLLRVIGTGRQVRDFCYVDDVVDAFLLVADHPGEVFNAGSGIPTTISSLAEHIKARVAPMARSVTEGKSWRGDIESLLADATKLRALGFSPKVDLDAGIEKLLAWYDSFAVVSS